ncbi:GL24364 [Drosophila persimilis]|uniref:GL24364 n=1 Tax=Drosophila persimilis TaxID=7234 RepID=B4G5I1_DROPE|nr:GL24364 [Drosophila persimilis]
MQIDGSPVSATVGPIRLELSNSWSQCKYPMPQCALCTNMLLVSVENFQLHVASGNCNLGDKLRKVGEQ